MKKKNQIYLQRLDSIENEMSKNVCLYYISEDEIENLFMKISDEALSKTQPNYSWLFSFLFTLLLTSLTADFKSIFGIDLTFLNKCLPATCTVGLIILIFIRVILDNKKYKNCTEYKTKIVNKYIEMVRKKHNISNNIDYYE